MRYSLVTVAVVGLGVHACELPKAPTWDVEVLLPYASDTLTWHDFLPNTVRVDTVGSTPVFATPALADSVELRLGDICSLCEDLDGQTVQVPGFQYTDSLDLLFAPELVTINVISAVLEIRITNRFNFDPLRTDPNPTNAGHIALVARDIAMENTIDSALISGANDAIAPGETRAVQLRIANAEISEGVRIVVHVVSPQDGQTVTIDANLAAKVTVLFGSIQISRVTVVVDDRTLDERGQIEVDGTVRDALARRTQGGVIELELQHDLDLDGVFRASIAGSPLDLFSGDTTRDIALNEFAFTAGMVQARALTVEQVRQIAAFDTVYVGYQSVASGTQTGPSGQSKVARFTPGQFLHVRLDLRSVRRIDF